MPLPRHRLKPRAMKSVQFYFLLLVVGSSLAGCSTDTPQASAQIKKQFAGGPMPPDAQKAFQESMRRSQEMMQQRAQNGKQAGGK